jgi:hypothetical protein
LARALAVLLRVPVVPVLLLLLLLRLRTGACAGR